MPESALVFYVDEQMLLALANWVLDYLLLWAAAATTRTYTRWVRLAAGACVGTLYYVLYALSLYGLFPFYGYLRMLPMVVAVSVFMLITTFAPLTWGRLRLIAAHFYIISFVSAGSGLAGAYLFGQPGVPNPLVGITVALGSMLLVAELGWGVLQRRSWQQGLQVPIDVTFGNCVTRITALLDTGNRLREPISGAPVLVVEHASLAGMFPPHLAQALEQLETGNLREVTSLVSSMDWSTRFRIIPFTSVGTASGIMVGFRPDQLTLWLDGQPYPLLGCTVALSPRPLDSSGCYHGLIGPEMVENATQQYGERNIRVQRCNHQKEERAHAVTHG